MTQGEVLESLAERFLGLLKQSLGTDDFTPFRSIMNTGITTALSGFLFIYSRQVRQKRLPPLDKEMHRLLSDRKRQPIDRLVVGILWVVRNYQRYVDGTDRARIDEELRSLYETLHHYFKEDGGEE